MSMLPSFTKPHLNNKQIPIYLNKGDMRNRAYLAAWLTNKFTTDFRWAGRVLPFGTETSVMLSHASPDSIPSTSGLFGPPYVRERDRSGAAVHVDASGIMPREPSPH